MPEVHIHKVPNGISSEDLFNYIKNAITGAESDSCCCGECDDTEPVFTFEYALQAMRNGYSVSHTATDYDFFIKSDKVFKFDPRTMKVEPAVFMQDDIMSNEWYVVE